MERLSEEQKKKKQKSCPFDRKTTKLRESFSESFLLILESELFPMTTETGQSSRSKPSDDDDDAWAKLGLPFFSLLPSLFVLLLRTCLCSRFSCLTLMMIISFVFRSLHYIDSVMIKHCSIMFWVLILQFRWTLDSQTSRLGAVIW